MLLPPRPRSHAELDLVLHAVSAALDAADPALVALDRALFLGARTAYLAAREAHFQAFAASRAARERAEAADADFARDLRAFATSIRDRAGEVPSYAMFELLGGILPSALTRRAWSDEVHRAHGLLFRVGVRTDLRCDPNQVAALRASTAALELAMGAEDAARRALHVAGHRLDEAKRIFDRGYGQFARAVASSPTSGRTRCPCVTLPSCPLPLPLPLSDGPRTRSGPGIHTRSPRAGGSR